LPEAGYQGVMIDDTSGSLCLDDNQLNLEYACMLANFVHSHEGEMHDEHSHEAHSHEGLVDPGFPIWSRLSAVGHAADRR
jgi:hypothetical protein